MRDYDWAGSVVLQAVDDEMPPPPVPTLAAHYLAPSAAGAKPSLSASGVGHGEGSLFAGLENSTFNMTDLYKHNNKVSIIYIAKDLLFG